MTSRDIPAQHLPLRHPDKRDGPLAGIRIIDLTTSIAGPYASMLLGDMGAEIVKVERPGVGDDSRQWGPPFINGIALWYLAVNRNKRSLTLNYSVAEGYRLLLDLVRQSDVVLTNHVPRVQKKLGIDDASLRAARADIVHVSLTGYGLTGEGADRPCYDIIAEGISGVMDMTGELDNDPQKIGTPAADLLGGTDAAMACLAALVERRSNGRGKKIDVSLVESMTRLMTPILMSHLGSGLGHRRSGAKDSVIAVYQMFHTADEPLTLALPNDGIWQRFCAATGLNDFIDNPDFRDSPSRRKNRDVIVARIDKLLRTRPRDQWLALFAENRIPAGPINRIDQIAADIGLHQRGLFYAIPSAGEPIPQVGLGIQFDGQPVGYRLAPPGLGQDNEFVLGDILGLSAGEIAQLNRANII